MQSSIFSQIGISNYICNYYWKSWYRIRTDFFIWGWKL